MPIKSDIVVRFMGKKMDLHLKKKGKVLGLLWMNLDAYTFENVPNVCLIHSTREFKALAKPLSVEQSDVMKLTLQALKNDVKIEPATRERDFLVRELVKMKGRSGLYVQIPGSVKLELDAKGNETFTTKIHLPSSLVPGNYLVEVYALQNGKIVASKVQPITAKLVGLPAFLFTMAFKHALLYGLLATVVAILAGLLMGLIFGAGGAH